MSEVPATRTPWATRDLLAAYAAAWRSIVGGELSREGLALLWGQACVECGRAGKSCYGWNVGNIMPGPSWQGDYHVLKSAPECYDADKIPQGATVLANTNIACAPGKIAAIPPGGSKFRAYASLLDGCADKLLRFKSQWPRALSALAKATSHTDADVFVAGLIGPPRYFTASSTTYAHGVRLLAIECLKQTPDSEWPELPRPSQLPTPPRPIEVPNALDFVRTLATDEEPKA
jgi:hypothetical protein